MNPVTSRNEARKYGAAKAHRDASPNTKRAAARNRVTLRTAQKWAKPDAGGSPQETYNRYLETAENPFRLEAHCRAVVMQRHLARLSDRELIDRIHMALARDAGDEGADNVAKVTRGLSLHERAVIAERDAATDIELASLYREAAARGIGEARIFGGQS